MLRLREARINNGLTQKEVAAYLNVTQTAVSDWERSEREPDLETITKLAKLFKVSTDYLLGRDEAQHDNDDEALEFLDEIHKRPEMKTLFQVTRKATKEDIETAVTVVEALKKKRGED